MVLSMTGFGRSEVSHGAYHITAEIRSVNNRYLDLNIKLPRKLGAAEAEVRSLIKRYVRRGKTDVYITCVNEEGGDARVRYNRVIAEEYLHSLQQMSQDFGMENDVRLATLARFPDVFTMEDETVDENEIVPGVLQAVEQACRQFTEAREREGSFLRTDLTEKLGLLEESVSFIKDRSPVIVEEYKKNLREKIADLASDVQIDEARLTTEITIFADKICVDEELVRLSSHIAQVRDALEHGDDKDGIGRRLDFIAQEMNREANTILSKSTDKEIADCGIGLKTTIEKIREQIQNIE